MTRTWAHPTIKLIYKQQVKFQGSQEFENFLFRMKDQVSNPFLNNKVDLVTVIDFFSNLVAGKHKGLNLKESSIETANVENASFVARQTTFRQLKAKNLKLSPVKIQEKRIDVEPGTIFAIEGTKLVDG